MKTQALTYSLADCAHHVAELIADHSPRFVAVVVTPNRPLYGWGRNTWDALTVAAGFLQANYIVADSKQSESYAFDESFGRDVSRLYNDAGDVLAILVRC